MKIRSVLPFAVFLVLALMGSATPGMASPKSETVQPLPENPNPSSMDLGSGGSFAPVRRLYPRKMNDAAPQPSTASCACANVAQPETLAFTLTTYNSNGSMATDLPRAVGTPNLPIGSAHWAPERFYGPLLGGFKTSRKKLGRLFRAIPDLPHPAWPR